MSLTTQDKQEIKSMLDTSIKAGTAHLPTVVIVRDILKKETAHLPTEDKVRQMIQEGIQTSPIILRMEAAISRLEVLNEDMSHRIDSMLEVLSVVPEISTKVNKHEVRLQEVESKQPLILKTLALHSKQLGAKL